MAVLYRTNAQSRVLEEAFVRGGIPYHVYGGQKFYERKEVKDLIAYMRALVNPDDDVSLRRIINEPKRGIGETTVEALQQLRVKRRDVADVRGTGRGKRAPCRPAEEAHRRVRRADDRPDRGALRKDRVGIPANS